MRLIFLALFTTFSYYFIMVTSTGGRTMYVNTENGVHRYDDTLNIRLYFFKNKVAIEQRGQFMVYSKSEYSQHSETLYFMKPPINETPNCLFIYHKEDDQELYMRYYYLTNKRELYLSKTEIYHDIKKRKYDGVSTIPKRNNKRRLKEAIHQ